MCLCVPAEARRGEQFPGAGATGGCEPPDTDAGNCKGSRVSAVVAGFVLVFMSEHLFSLLFLFCC